MTNQELLNRIRTSIDSGEISKAELQAIISGSTDSGASSKGGTIENLKKESTNSLVSKVLFAIGGLIAIIGVIVLVAQNWSAIGAFGRLVATLGVSAVAYALAIIMNKRERLNETSVYFAVSAATLPIGLFVLLRESGMSDSMTGTGLHMLISAISFAVFASALWATRKNILHLVAGAFATWFTYAIVANAIQGNDFTFSFIKDAFVYVSMMIALCYLSYGSWLKTKFGESRVSKIFIFLAFGLFMGSALFLTGIWNLLYAFLAVGSVALSIRLRSTAALTVSAIAISVYLVKISAQYFSDSVGWALLLVLIGFLIISLGYATYYLNKKYIHEEKTGR
ncbi:MAG TPA: DUF2157 domain-containing protein [Candidatus Paceibacterota bacterium]